MYKKGSGNDKQGKDAGNRTLCPYRNFSQAIKGFKKADRRASGTTHDVKVVSEFTGKSPTIKISPVVTNPENTHSYKMAHISLPRDDKSNLKKV